MLPADGQGLVVLPYGALFPFFSEEGRVLGERELFNLLGEKSLCSIRNLSFGQVFQFFELLFFLFIDDGLSRIPGEA